MGYIRTLDCLVDCCGIYYYISSIYNNCCCFFRQTRVKEDIEIKPNGSIRINLDGFIP